jgi:hypothetical protein
MVREYYNDLSPSDQLAINQIVDSATDEELETTYKKAKSREAYKKRFHGEDAVIIIVLIFIAVLLFVVLIHLSTYADSIRKMGVEICQSHNSTYKYMYDGNPFEVKIVCTDSQWIYP